MCCQIRVLSGHQDPSVTTTIERRIKLPDSMSQGAALYKLILRYECNIIHKWWPIISKPTDVTFVVKGPRIESSP
jgi:hypothetical protein